MRSQSRESLRYPSGPNGGTGLSQTFKATYSYTNAESDLQVVYLDIGAGVGTPHSCFVPYVVASNQLFLFNDINSATLGPITSGSAAMQSNSKCTLSGSGGAATVLNNDLTVQFAIIFNAAYTGSKDISGQAQGYTAAVGANTFLGTWTPSEPALAAVSVSPINGSGPGPLTFSALYTNANGATDLQAVYPIFGRSPQPRRIAASPPMCRLAISCICLKIPIRA